LWFFFSGRRGHTWSDRDWSSDVCSSDLFLSQGRLAPLSALTLEPTREPLAVAGAAVDRYVPAGLPGSAPLVLVHGFAPEGKDDEIGRASWRGTVTLPGISVRTSSRNILT